MMSAEVLAKPVQRGDTGLPELREIRVEMAALDRNQPLRLQSSLVRSQREVGDGDGVAHRDHHQQRCR